MPAMSRSGKVRRSQLISTYGIGAIIDLEKGSFMPMGLEDWESMPTALALADDRRGPAPGTARRRPLPSAPGRRGHPRHSRTGESRQSRAGGPLSRTGTSARKCHRIGTESDPFQLAPDGSPASNASAMPGKRVATTPVRFVRRLPQGAHRRFPVGMVGAPEPRAKASATGRRWF